MRNTPTLPPRGEHFLFKNGLGGTISQYRNKQIIYSQGKTANSLFYIREGDVMLTIRSKDRRPAVITILGAGDFFGQSCLAGVPLRMCTATAIGSSSILTIKKNEMNRILRRDSETSNSFVSYLLSVIKQYQENLVDLLVNSSEQRLASVLLHLAQLGANGGRVPKINQQVLADMIGTTRSRTNVLMNRFRKRGFIDYNGEIKVHRSLRTMYLRHQETSPRM
jgi:CRP/FNR family transcriptional regulator, cyclic AMP receptor protein